MLFQNFALVTILEQQLGIGHQVHHLFQLVVKVLLLLYWQFFLHHRPLGIIKLPSM